MTILCILSVGVMVCGAAMAQPSGATRVLEDFEGELRGWPLGVEVVPDASQGQRAISWKPAVKTDPQALGFSFAGRGVEMVDWDRLRFDYKIVGEGCNWWGVKITDAPLANGMQATWQLADRQSLKLGQWQEAVIPVQNPTWLWGQQPDLNSQRIDFRCQLDAGKSVTILLDHIRLERDPVRLERVEAGEARREGDALRREYTVHVANNQDVVARIAVALHDTAPRLSAACDPQALQLQPGTKGDFRVQLSAALTGPEAAPPVTTLTTTLSVKVAGMNAESEKTAVLELPVPLGEVPHPCLLLTKEIARRALEKTKTSADAKAAYEALKRHADDWLAKTPDYPDRGGQWWHWYTCKKCGARLSAKSPTQHVCQDCGAVYTGWPYDDVYLDTIHNELARAIRDCGLMYAFTGEPAYAAKAREILLGYAERYLSYPLHDINGKPNKGGGHVGPQSLDESTWLIPVAQGFDCIYDALSSEDRKTIADRLLLPAAWLIHDHQWGIHNICCWHDSAYGLVGLVLGEQKLAADAINGPKGFHAQVAKGITDDGQWYEGAWGYHYYTMSALQPLAIAMHNLGMDAYGERYKSMYTAPLQFMGPGGELPAFNDSGTSNALGGGAMYEVAYARWKDPLLLLPVMRQASRRSLEALLFGAELGAAPDFRLASQVFPAAGFVILRSGEVGTTGADRYIPSNYLALDWGPHGGGHGHPDKLSFVLYGHRALLGEDPGCIAYGNPAHQGWFRQTLSHNTVVVNGKSQKACTGTLQFAAFGEGMGLCSARADSAYDGVRLRRTVALCEDRIIDVFLCEAAQDSTFDWCYHNRGTMATALPLAPLEAAPTGDGYSWAKEWRGCAAKDAWGAVWRTDGGPGLALAQAATSAERQVLSAVGMGNPTRIKNPFVVSRVQGKVALFCSALSILEGDAAPQLTVRELPVDAGGSGEERAVAVEVTDGGVRDVLLVNPAGGEMRVGDLRMVGQGALLRYADGELKSVLCVGGAEVYVGGEVVGRAG